MGIDLKLYENRVFSQWGEDGVLTKIFEVIGVTNKYFVEFGSAGVDEGGGNTAYLRRLGFDGLLMDSNPWFIGRTQYDLKIHLVTVENVEELFRQYNVPATPDLLSIDIDGNDFYIWQAIKNYRPRVVVIEMNGVFPSDVDWVQLYNLTDCMEAYRMFGASYRALCNLAKVKGYTPVYVTCAMHETHSITSGREPVNMFLVRQDEDVNMFRPFQYVSHYGSDALAYQSEVVQELLRRHHKTSEELI